MAAPVGLDSVAELPPARVMLPPEVEILLKEPIQMAPLPDASAFDQRVTAPPEVVNAFLVDVFVPLAVTTSCVAFNKIGLAVVLVRLLFTVIVLAKTEIDPDEVSACEIVMSAAFWVAPDTVPPVPD